MNGSEGGRGSDEDADGENTGNISSARARAAGGPRPVGRRSANDVLEMCLCGDYLMGMTTGVSVMEMVYRGVEPVGGDAEAELRGAALRGRRW